MNKQYTLKKNLRYSMSFAWKNSKILVISTAFSVPIKVATTFISLYMPTIILNAINSVVFDYSVTIILGILLFKLFIDIGSIINTAINNIGITQAQYKRELLCSFYIMTMDYSLTEDSNMLNLLYPLRSNKAVMDLLMFQNVANIIIAFCNFFVYGSTISTLAMLGEKNTVPVIIFCLFIIFTVLINQIIWNRIRDNQVEMGIENDADRRKIDYITRKSSDFSCAKDIRLFSLFNLFYRKGKESILSLEKRTRKRDNKRISGPWIVSNFLGVIRDAAAYAYLIVLASIGTITAPQFVLFFSAITGLSGMINELSSSWVNLQNVSAKLTKWRIAEEKALERNSGTSSAPLGNIDIKFDHVSFRFPHSKNDIIHDINFEIHSGEKIAIVGVNGAGKTTLVKLLCGFYQPTSGCVLINGLPVSEYSQEEYYKIISVVFQKFTMLPLTIKENVASCEKKYVNDEKVWDCIVRAGLEEKVLSLKNGINTLLVREVNSDAIDLSGGERQKLMLAKALYKNAPLLVLDEPTAAMDPISEHKFYQEYGKLLSETTSIFISHRLASTRFCDRIFLLDNGCVCEQGTHEELMELKGLYRKMYETQSQYYKDEGNWQ